MIRRDNSQDAEKGRFYSNYWIEVAMGKDSSQGASAALADEDVDLADLVDLANSTDANAMADLDDLPIPEEFVAPAPPPKPVKSKPTEKKQEAPRSLSSLADLASIEMLMKNSADLGDEAEVDLAADEAQDLDVPLTTNYTFDENADENADEEAVAADADTPDEFEDEEFEDEEEEDTGWGGGRKPKQPKPLKPRREPRRPY
jgi:hypothetical protein